MTSRPSPSSRQILTRERLLFSAGNFLSLYDDGLTRQRSLPRPSSDGKASRKRDKKRRPSPRSQQCGLGLIFLIKPNTKSIRWNKAVMEVKKFEQQTDLQLHQRKREPRTRHSPLRSGQRCGHSRSRSHRRVYDRGSLAGNQEGQGWNRIQGPTSPLKTLL